MRLNGLGRLGVVVSILGLALLTLSLYGVVADPVVTGFTQSLLFMNGLVVTVTGVTFWAAGRFKGSIG